MVIDRIVSFLPSATELLYALGVQDNLYGVTHECKYPSDAKSKLQIIDSVINSDKLTSKEIDTKTCQLLKDGEEIFVLNEKNLANNFLDMYVFSYSFVWISIPFQFTLKEQLSNNLFLKKLF